MKDKQQKSCLRVEGAMWQAAVGFRQKQEQHCLHCLSPVLLSVELQGVTGPSLLRKVTGMGKRTEFYTSKEVESQRDSLQVVVGIYKLLFSEGPYPSIFS